MLDANQLFSSAQVVAADAFSTNAINVKKTAGDGLWIELDVTAFSGFTGVVVTCYERAADSGWAVTDPAVGISRSFAAVGRYWFKVSSKLAFIKLNYDTTGAGSFTVTAGISSGPQRDTSA